MARVNGPISVFNPGDGIPTDASGVLRPPPCHGRYRCRDAAPFTTPPGAYTAVVSLLPDANTGITGDIRVDCVAMYPASTYDPLA